MDLSRSLIYKIAHCAMLSSKYTARVLSSHGVNLTPEEAVILDQLCELGRQTQRQLGAVVAKGPSAVSRHIDSLYRKGFVSRQTEEQDRRNTWIAATDAGAAVRAIVASTGLPEIDAHMPALSPDALKAVDGVLDVFIDALNQDLSEPQPAKGAAAVQE